MNATALTDIRKRAKAGIDRADDTTVKMILAMLDVQADEEAVFDAEMNRRFEEYEQGKVKTLSLNELEERARANHKKKAKVSR
jgi:hypothetical protein